MRGELARFAKTATAVLCLAVILAVPHSALAKSHGLSAFGDLKYPADFQQFDYVNADAPKGGRISMTSRFPPITYDSFNFFILKGDSQQSLRFVYDSLMARAYDEPDAMYGLVAHSAAVADDGRSVTFFLRPEARFADGEPLTADDVVFTFDKLKSDGKPAFRLGLVNVVSAEALDDHTVRYTFEGDNTRDLPLFVAGLPIAPAHWYDNEANPFEDTFLKPPLGSGPYEITNFRAGQFITYSLRDDYWAKDLPVNVGRYNFRELRYEFFRDRVAELQALLAGEYALREEFTSRDWATGYDVEPVRDGRIVREVLPDGRPAPLQGWFWNLRRDRFQDRRVREALDHAFDFEWTNKNLFYELYERKIGYFDGTDMAATGAPGADELALLEPFRDQLSPGAFGDVYVPPVSDGSGQDRRLLRRASQLLSEAGWTLNSSRQRVNAAGEVFRIEFLTFSPTFERILNAYIKNLKLLGIDGSIRLVDPAQYQRRLKDFDFDVVTVALGNAPTPGESLRNVFSSEAAGAPGSFNVGGIKNPVVDALLDRITGARSRDELKTAVRALDRVLRSENYWTSHWGKAEYHIAYWDRFSRPTPAPPPFERAIIDTWWYEATKAAALEAKSGGRSGN